ncbi:GNAT family N-acetyltransferase [Paenibacillus soyae]|uniref:GNAT family N-acetyltransferase n=1 Tax=Paenibacillus soyae TaxID=2969249 RepID=A0A9X2MMH3_9BACL|nr:GNAT family N-acetyltransferase [Paenibacillus soyae]MCR2802829.1 GNAT family N-acetyltransferase [Paenibacillus soyae]
MAMLTRGRVQNREQREEAYRIRTEVFVNEQGVSPDIEIDEHEEVATHVLVYYDGQPVGAGRVREVEGVAKLERICVLAPFRKHKAGAAIMAELEEVAKEWGLSKAKLHAQTHAAGFYGKLGYAVDSDEFMEDGIPHVRMIKKLG